MAFFLGAAFFGYTSATFVPAAETRLGMDARQMVVCLAPSDSSSEGSLQLFQRDSKGAWRTESKPWPVLFGRGGMAWGRGLNPSQSGRQRASNDHRNPAGLFRIGFALGYAAALPPGAKGWPYHQVTERDAWIDNPALPNYNHLYTLPPGAPTPPWWNDEKLHLGDNAYQWMVLIEHNYDHPVANAGTDIFFHVRRGEHYRTAGCTTMSEPNLERLIKWLQPGSNAMLVELSRANYLRLWRDWQLPPPALLQ